MEINHSLEAKDYVNFNLFQIQYSEKLKKRLTVQRWIVSILFVVVAIIAFSLLSRFRLLTTTLFLFASIFWYGYFPIFSKNQIVKSTEKTMARGQLSSLFDEVRLNFDSNGLTEITKQGEHRSSWKEIQSISLTEDYFYFYLTSTSAVIIPKRALSPEESNELKELIDSHYQGNLNNIKTQ